MIYKTIDLCAGIGGIRKGFELTGKFENVLSAEIDLYACNTYKHLYGKILSMISRQRSLNTRFLILIMMYF